MFKPTYLSTMAVNACIHCGNALGTEDCKDACSNRKPKVPVKQKTLLQTHFQDDLLPYIAQIKAEVESRIGKKIDLDKAPIKLRNEIMGKATVLWLKAKK